jgi:drug/metabolite transporter (DMT)-like permease
VRNFYGEFAGLGTALCWSVGSIFFTTSSRRMGHHIVNRLRLVLGLVLLLIVHYVFTGQLLPQGVTGYQWFWFGLSGIIGFAIGDTMLFRSFVLVGPRLSMLMMALVPIFSTLIAWLFLHEVLGMTDILAIGVTLIGICWVVLSRSKKTGKIDRYAIGLLFGVGGALGQALGLILSKQGLANNFSALDGNIIRIFTAVIVVWLISLVRGTIPRTFRSLKDKKAALAMSTGAFLGPFLGVWLSLIAVQLTYVGIASTLMALPPIFLLPLSYWIFKEKITGSAILGTIVAVVGVALIFLL